MLYKRAPTVVVAKPQSGCCYDSHPLWKRNSVMTDNKVKPTDRILLSFDLVSRQRATVQLPNFNDANVELIFSLIFFSFLKFQVQRKMFFFYLTRKVKNKVSF